MIEKTFVGFGLAVQLVGAYIAFRGYRLGWNENASASDRFMAPVVAWTDKVHARVVSFVRRLFRRRPNVRVVAGTANATLGGLSVSVRGSVVPGPLSAGLDTESAIAELDRRLRTLIDMVNKAEFALGDERTERQEAVTRIENAVTATITDQAEKTRQQNLRGLRIEAFGFIVLTIGAVIQGIGVFFG